MDVTLWGLLKQYRIWIQRMIALSTLNVDDPFEAATRLRDWGWTSEGLPATCIREESG